MIGGLIVHRQFGRWPAFAQATPLREDRQQFINCTETCANKVVQVHGVPPQKLALLLSKVGSMSLSFGKKTCTSGKLTLWNERGDILCAQPTLPDELITQVQQGGVIHGALTADSVIG